MTPEEKRRAGRAVASRIAWLRTTVPAVARQAGVDPKTIRSLISGDTWPTARTRERINSALDWPRGELARRASDESGLATFETVQLLSELCRRAEAAGF